jgi:hypothetical protein
MASAAALLVCNDAALTNVAHAQSTYRLVAGVIGASGGQATSAQGFQLIGTLGQAIPAARMGQGSTLAGTGFWSRFVGQVLTATPDNAPAMFFLSQNYPNPFNPVTAISYGVPESQMVQLVIYGLRGNKVRSLVQQVQAPGLYRVLWDGTDGSGRRQASGAFLYRLQVGSDVQVKRMLLLK